MLLKGIYSWGSGERVGGVGKNDCTSSKVQPWRKKEKGVGVAGGKSLSLPLSQAGFWLPVLVVWNNELILMVAGWLPALPPPLPSPPYTHTLPPPACPLPPASPRPLLQRQTA